MFRRILHIPLSFLYAFYLQIEQFIPWTVIRFFVSFGKKQEKHKSLIHFLFLNLVQSLIWPGRPVDPLTEIEDYCVYFDNQYGTNHPAFYRGRLSQVI